MEQIPLGKLRFHNYMMTGLTVRRRRVWNMVSHQANGLRR